MSELASLLTYERFCVAFEHFLAQADENTISGKSNGEQFPFGLPGDGKGKLKVDGKELGQSYGQGGKSGAPYFNWHIVSIYYIPEHKRLVLGIELNQDRYPALSRLHPSTHEEIGKGKKVAIFGQYIRQKIDYKKLHEDFMNLSEKIRQIGLN